MYCRASERSCVRARFRRSSQKSDGGADLLSPAPGLAAEAFGRGRAPRRDRLLFSSNSASPNGGAIKAVWFSPRAR
uniref:hypothetical protein n=1 Tax=Aporhodopirellula aestuarii TaxID=2950107 RepID=UPI0038996573